MNRSRNRKYAFYFWFEPSPSRSGIVYFCARYLLVFCSVLPTIVFDYYYCELFVGEYLSMTFVTACFCNLFPIMCAQCNEYTMDTLAQYWIIYMGNSRMKTIVNRFHFASCLKTEYIYVLPIVRLSPVLPKIFSLEHLVSFSRANWTFSSKNVSLEHASHVECQNIMKRQQSASCIRHCLFFQTWKMKPKRGKEPKPYNDS